MGLQVAKMESKDYLVDTHTHIRHDLNVLE